MNDIKFISKDAVLLFQVQLINQYGGRSGLRDEGLLESALAQPAMGIAGKYLHQDIFTMAAAYGYHLCGNHPFIDGNKRVALVTMDSFLYMNGYNLEASEREAYIMILDLANGQVSKEELAGWLRDNTKKRT